MEKHIFRRQWQSLKNGFVSEEELRELSRNVALSFIDSCYKDGSYVSEYIDLLCEMATHFPETHIGNAAGSVLFELIVEQICDDYENLPEEIYRRIMSQVVTYCRHIPAGTEMDKALTGFGLHTFDDIYRRAEKIYAAKYSYDINKAPEKIVLLSRVTIGADVAILSVMTQRLMKIFPGTEILVIGSSKLSGVFGGNPRIRICPLNYARRGGLFERFSSWFEALNILEGEISPENCEKILLIDPDSRISQLGVLPLVQSNNYLFFNSRKCYGLPASKCMAELTNHWMDSIFGKSDFCYPAIWTNQKTSFQAEKIINELHNSGCKKIIAVNFGVGANHKKRLGIEFEKNLLRKILENFGTVVLMDKGSGEDELSQSSLLLSDLSKSGFKTFSDDFGSSIPRNLSHGLIALTCTIGEIAALIAKSDQYIGYDSACQHIAAAAKTPTLTVFSGTTNMNFVQRWKACGDTLCRIIHTDTFEQKENTDPDEVVSRIIRELDSMAIKTPEKMLEIRELKSSSYTKDELKKTPKP